MPLRIDQRELQGGSIGGVPYCAALGRGGRVVLYVAAYDSDGLLETPEDCKREAVRFNAAATAPKVKPRRKSRGGDIRRGLE
jgi:hypothetical protein